MTNLIRNIFLFSLLLSHSIIPQSLKEIEVEGNEIFSDTEIKNWANLYEGQTFTTDLLDSAKTKVAVELNSAGYFHSSFKDSKIELSPDSQTVNVFLNVEEGNPTYVNELVFSTDDTLNTDEYFLLFNYLKEEIFNRYEIETSIVSLLSDLENKGFPFAAVKIQSVHFYDDTLNNEHYADLHLKLTKGLKGKIDKIEVAGNSSTKDYVVIRELRIDTGEEYSQERVNNFPKRLNKLRFFQPVQPPQFFVDSENNGVLIVTVKEKNTNNFDGVIGYVPPANDNETGYITGLVNVTLRNIFGTGRAAAVRWQKLTRESQELEVKYLEPWLFSFPFNLNAELYQRIQDTTYVQRRIGGALEFLATEDISASAFLSTEEVIPTEREAPVFTVYNSSTLTTGLSLKIDLRDDPLAPTGGLLFETSYSFSRKKINGPAKFIPEGLETNPNLQRITAAFSAFYELFFRNIVAISVNGKELSGPFFEQSDLWRFGGTGSVRGYREEQFLASRIAWSNIEYRLMLTPRSYAFVFFDAGYYSIDADEEQGVTKNEDVIFGYGLGITVETAIGLLGVSFALADGDSFSEGKIHFGIINEF
ncbi:MAG: BamA/TamA family outer membrane protein [Ignavibacteria bacterium]|nr:BamA/TamA family outer membrane protein [Ignavibacteria bacterium]MBT8381377.1 BamA/TamA family outer membrane protein [Ignavibacteria bacterium]MBT8391354.1 BamA/TamA family outer membrane protein [Ignavibacteria bacterium]NNJ53024.1 BamA/TamA family outer membrane protein [Ignavibacteriaceae bacterium]NNL21461.1 BamA/TamA family outer membrane protein [Ignavibacteriaceae bacterium]